MNNHNERDEYNIDKGTYQTRDVYITASLLASGCTIVDMTKNEKQFTFFVTHETEDVRGLVMKFWNGDLLIDAKKLFGSFRELRARMYN
jgi:hypothetical protein